MENMPVEVNRFKQVMGPISEHFPEYLVIVRPPTGGVFWKASDSTWAMGAAQRYIDNIRMVDDMELQELRDSE